MFKPHQHRERLLSSGFAFLLPSPCPGVFSSLGDSGVSSPKGGSRLLSGPQCQSLDFQTMLLCPAGPVPGAARTPLGFPASPERRASGLRSRPLRSLSTFSPLAPRTLLFLAPGSILTQDPDRQTLARVIYKRGSNLQTSSKLHRVGSGHLAAHFCTFHPGRRIGGSGLAVGNVLLSLGYCSALSVEEGKKKSSLYFPFSFPSVVGRWADTGSAARSHGDTQAFIVLR